MNAHFRKDIEYVLSKMESSSICYLVEMEILLRFIQHAHVCCSYYCTLDSFSDMLISLVESDVSTNNQNRVNQWIRKELYTLVSTGVYDTSKKVYILLSLNFSVLSCLRRKVPFPVQTPFMDLQEVKTASAYKMRIA